MAAAPQRDNWEAKVDRMNEVQLRSLDKVPQDYIDDLEKDIDPNIKPEKDPLQIAEDINLITSATRKIIVDQLKIITDNDETGKTGHLSLFKRAYWHARYGSVEKNADKKKPRLDQYSAFKQAFESVYGRFMLEQGGGKYKRIDEGGNVVEVDIDGKDSELMQMLDKVLKFKVDAKLGLKGRSELQAVVRRLREVVAAKEVGEDRAADIAKLEAKKADKESRLTGLEARATEIGAIGDLLEKIGNSTDLNTDFAALQAVQAKIKDLDDRSTALSEENSVKLPADLAAAKAEMKVFLDRIASMGTSCEAYLGAMDAGGFAVKDRAKFDAAIAKIKAIKIDSKADFESWKKLLSDELEPLMKGVKPIKIDWIVDLDSDKKQAVNTAVKEVGASMKKIAGDIGKLPKIFTGKLQELVDKLDGIAKRVQANTDELAKVTTDKSGEVLAAETLANDVRAGLLKMEPDVNTLKAQIGSLKTPTGDDLLPDAVAKCDDYLAKLAAFKAPITVDLLEKVNLAMKDYQTFVAELGTLLAKPRADADTELMDAHRFLAEFDAKHKRLKSYKTPALRIQDILDRAFGIQKTPDEMKALEDKHHHAEHKKHALEEDKKYFSDDADTGVKGIHKRYKELLGSETDPSKLPTTADSLLEKKAAFDLRTKEKAKLGELETLFGEKKLSEVQDKFLELAGLLPSYLSSGAGDFESKITDKQSEADLVKGAIDNYEKTGRPAIETSLTNERANLSRLQGESNVDAGKVRALEASIAQLVQKLSDKDQELETNKVKFKQLSVAVSQLGKFKAALTAFRTEILDLARGCEKAIELGIIEVGIVDTDSEDGKKAKKKVKKAEIGKFKEFFEALNVNSDPASFDQLKAKYDELKKNFTDVSKRAETNLNGGKYGLDEEQLFKDETGKIEKAKKLYEELEPLVSKFGKAVHHGVNLVVVAKKDASGKDAENPDGTIVVDDEASHKASEKAAKDMEVAFKALIKPDHKDFKVADVASFYKTHLATLLDSHGHDGHKSPLDTLKANINSAISRAEKEVKDTTRKLSEAKEAAEKSKDLTDVKAARKIVEVLVAEEFPGISAADQAKIAKLVLAGDVGKLMTEKSYAEMAREGSAEVLDTVKQVGLRARLIGFRYKDGDKVVHPFDGLKPESFKDWPSIRNLFDIKKLNYKNGAFLLAALEIFDEEKNEGKDDKDKVVSVQTSGVEKKLKELLAEQLGVKDRVDEAGVKKIVDDAFKAQMEKVRPLVRTHFENFGRDSKGYQDAMKYKVELLVLEVEELEYKLRKGEIDFGSFDLEMKKILKSAEEADVMDELRKKLGFSHNTVVSKLWNNKYSQLARDKGINWSKFIGSKLGRGLWGATKGTGRGMISAGGKLGLRTGSVGLSIAKLPAALLMGVGSGIFRIFRGGHGGSWWKDVRADVAKVTDPMSKWKESMVKTSKELKVTSHIKDHTKAEWAKPKLGTEKHEERERVKKKAAIRAARIKLLKEKAEMKILEVTESPFIDLAEFKARVKKLNKMVGEEDADFPADTAQAGAVKKPGEHDDKDDKHDKKEAPADNHHKKDH